MDQKHGDKEDGTVLATDMPEKSVAQITQSHGQRSDEGRGTAWR